MAANKERIYVALYARGGSPTIPGAEDTYHRALLVGPKTEDQGTTGFRFHAKTCLSTSGAYWDFDESKTSMMMTNALLVRVLIGKIEGRERLLSLLRNVAVVQNDPNWNCVVWVMQALSVLENDGIAMGTSSLEWKTVRDAAMTFCKRKRDEHRFDTQSHLPISGVPPTYDLLASKQVSP